MAEAKKRGRKPSSSTQLARKLDEKNKPKEYSIPSGSVHVCTCCGKHATKSSLEKLFYISYSPFHMNSRRCPICKECMVKNSTRANVFNFEMFIEVLREIDKPYFETELESSIQQVMNENSKDNVEFTKDVALKTKADAIIGYYIKNLALNFKELTFMDGDARKSINPTVDLLASGEYEEVNIEYLRRRWGHEMPIDDLVMLEEKYDEWESRYELEGNKNKEICVEQICYEELFIYKERQQGSKDVSKRLKNIQDLMKTANLSPKQESASETAEFETLGQFIKKVEQSKPFIRDNPEYKDVDGFEKMWRSLAGAIKRTVGRPDEDTQVFEDVYAEQTMDLTSLDKDE